MSLDTWVFLGTLVLVALGLWRSMNKNFTNLETRIDTDRQDAKADNQRLEDKIGKLDTKIDEARQEAKADNVAARKEARADNQRFREEVTTEIGALREHMDHGFARIDERLNVLEQRTYDIKPTGT